MSVKTSVEGITTSTEEQEKIKRQMEANSKAWHTADENTRKQLEQANRELANQLGGVTFNAESGTWSGTTGATAQSGSAENTVEDYSQYIKELSEARRRKTMAGLEQAYRNSLKEIGFAGESVEGQARADKNTAAAQSAKESRNFNEYAAAKGLSTGTAGQEALERSVALQSGLNAIDREKAAALSELELQRAKTEANHQTAVAAADAQEEQKLNEALLEEKIRVQNLRQKQAEAAQAQANTDREYEYKVARDKVEDSQWQSELAQMAAETGLASSKAASTRQDMLIEYGLRMLENGVMPTDDMLEALGMDRLKARNYIIALS